LDSPVARYRKRLAAGQLYGPAEGWETPPDPWYGPPIGVTEMRKVIHDELTIDFRDDTETKEVLYAKMLDWFVKTELFTGESLQQSDKTSVDSPILLSEIAEEIFKFDAMWKYE